MARAEDSKQAFESLTHKTPRAYYPMGNGLSIKDNSGSFLETIFLALAY